MKTPFFCEVGFQYEGAIMMSWNLMQFVWNGWMNMVNCAWCRIINMWLLLIETLIMLSFFSKVWLIFMEGSMIIVLFSLFLLASEPWNKFLCSLHLSVSMKVCLAFNGPHAMPASEASETFECLLYHFCLSFYNYKIMDRLQTLVANVILHSENWHINIVVTSHFV